MKKEEKFIRVLSFGCNCFKGCKNLSDDNDSFNYYKEFQASSTNDQKESLSNNSEDSLSCNSASNHGIEESDDSIIHKGENRDLMEPSNAGDSDLIDSSDFEYDDFCDKEETSSGDGLLFQREADLKKLGILGSESTFDK